MELLLDSCLDAKLVWQSCLTPPPATKQLLKYDPLSKFNKLNFTCLSSASQWHWSAPHWTAWCPPGTRPLQGQGCSAWSHRSPSPPHPPSHSAATWPSLSSSLSLIIIILLTSPVVTVMCSYWMLTLSGAISTVSLAVLLARASWEVKVVPVTCSSIIYVITAIFTNYYVSSNHLALPVTIIQPDVHIMNSQTAVPLCLWQSVFARVHPHWLKMYKQVWRREGWKFQNTLNSLSHPSATCTLLLCSQPSRKK